MTGAEPLGLDVEKADPEARSARCWRIRSLIVFLVLACLLPVMAGVAFFFFLKYEVDRDRFFWRPCSVLVCADNRCIDEQLFQIRFSAECFSNSRPNPSLFPASEANVY